MAKTDKPNILFIMSDDNGWFNISCNNNGIMGSFKELPIRQKPAGFSLQQVVEAAMPHP